MELAVCKFCGQIIADCEVPEGANEKEAAHLGTMECNCVQARAYQRRTTVAEKAKAELADVLLTDDKNHNIKAVEGTVYDLLKTAIDLIADDHIHKISVGLCRGGNVEVKAGSGGKISIKRSVSLTNKREVE